MFETIEMAPGKDDRTEAELAELMEGEGPPVVSEDADGRSIVDLGPQHAALGQENQVAAGGPEVVGGAAEEISAAEWARRVEGVTDEDSLMSLLDEKGEWADKQGNSEPAAYWKDKARAVLSLAPGARLRDITTNLGLRQKINQLLVKKIAEASHPDPDSLWNSLVNLYAADGWITSSSREVYSEERFFQQLEAVWKGGDIKMAPGEVREAVAKVLGREAELG